MATINNGNDYAQLSLSVEVLRQVNPDGETVSHGPAHFMAPVVMVDVTYRANGEVYFQTQLMVPCRCLLAWPQAIAAQMYAVEKSMIAFGMDSPEFQMWATPAHGKEGDTPEERFYTLDALVDVGALPGSRTVTYDGFQLHFSGVRGYELLDFARALAEETEEAPLK